MGTSKYNPGDRVQYRGFVGFSGNWLLPPFIGVILQRLPEYEDREVYEVSPFSWDESDPAIVHYFNDRALAVDRGDGSWKFMIEGGEMELITPPSSTIENLPEQYGEY